MANGCRAASSRARRPRRPDRATASADGGQRLGQRERARVQRLADDRALDTRGDQAAQGLQIGQARDPATGDDRPVGLFQIRSLEPDFSCSEWGFALAVGLSIFQYLTALSRERLQLRIETLLRMAASR